MNWKELLATKDVQKHKTSQQELNNMRELIARDLADAAVNGLSADRRLATAYNAALRAANMALACAGYRITSKMGHHKISFEGTRLALGPSADKYADHSGIRRRKRNVIDYTLSHVVSETEAKKILVWITNVHRAVSASRDGLFLVPPIRCFCFSLDTAHPAAYNLHGRSTGIHDS